MDERIGPGGEDLPPRDTLGCLFAAARVGCMMSILQVLMLIAIVFAALISLLFFR